MANNKSLTLPPHDLDAEDALIGAILSDSSSMDKVGGWMSAEDFYKKANGMIFQAVIDLYKESNPIDLLTVKDVLNKKDQLKAIGGASRLAEYVTQTPSTASAAYYAKIVKEKSTLRRLIEKSKEIVDYAFSEEKPIQELLDMAEQRIFEVSERGVVHDFTPISSTLEDAFERIDRVHRDKGTKRGVETGFYELDNLLSGFQPGDLVILAARPSMGKSSLAMDIVRHVGVRDKKPVAVFSLEMSNDQVVDRLIAGEGYIDLWKMRTGKLSDDDFQKISVAFGSLSEAPIFLDDSLTTNVFHIRSKARRLKAEHGLSLIMIDYLQLLEGSRKDNRVQEVSEISRQLKSLARELKVPILALAQLSRAVESRPDKRPILSDLRESGSIEQDADVVMFIYRDGYYKRRDEDDEEEDDNIAEILISKHRNGPTGMKKLFWDKAKVGFRNLEKKYE